MNVIALVLSGLLACSGVDQDPTNDTDLGQVDGVIFKGPFRAGGTITLTPQSDTLEAAGEPQEGTVSADDGSYSATAAAGLVRIEARGLALDEARGAQGPVELRLGAFAVLGASTDLHINLLTDLTLERVRRLILDGVDPAAAIEQAEDELTRALPIGVGDGPGARGAALDPYGDGYAQAWLFGVSAALAQAGRDREILGDGTVGDLMADLREDLAEDGELSAPLQLALRRGEAQLNPDLATLSLTTTLSNAGTGRPPPDLHAVLDTDQDGLVNKDDNCRYVPNPGQVDSLGLGFGDVCDHRLIGVSVNDRWGCGLRVADGRPTCWDVQGAPTGGTPPAPNVYPVHAASPWDGEPKLLGRYVEISVAEQVTCALEAAGDIHCDVDGVQEELVLEGEYTKVVASRANICGLHRDGAITCFDTTGARLVSDPGPYADFDVFNDGGICGLDTQGDLSWLNHPQAAALPALPAGAFAEVDASETGAGCAISTADGSLACFGDEVLVANAPQGSFSEVAVGAGVACAVSTDGALTCWRDPEVCPDVEPAPTSLRSLSAGGCQVCGLDERGVGLCWPRKWSIDNPGPR